MPTSLYNQDKALGKLTKDIERYEQFNESDEKLTWCGGCGNYKIQNSLKRALTLEKLGIQDVVMCFDVGCNGNGSDKMGGYTFHGLHGRVIPLASGCALANPDLTVIASAGDGATFSEGVNHLIHAVRNNYDMVFLNHNNSLYALTTGQPSATTRKGRSYNSAPDGVYLDPLNPLELVLSLRPSFVARTFSGDAQHMTKTFQEAINHDGFAFVEILQACPTYNKETPQKWFWDRIRFVDDLKDYDPTDLWAAQKLALDIEKEIYLGLIYHDPKKPSFMEVLPNRKGITTKPVDEVKHYNISKLLKEFE